MPRPLTRLLVSPPSLTRVLGPAAAAGLSACEERHESLPVVRIESTIDDWVEGRVQVGHEIRRELHPEQLVGKLQS